MRDGFFLDRCHTLRKECWYRITLDWDWCFCKYKRICKEQILYKVLFNELNYGEYDGYIIKVEKIGEGLGLDYRE